MPRRDLLERSGRTKRQRVLILTVAALLGALPFALPASHPAAPAFLVVWCLPVALLALLIGLEAGIAAAMVMTALLVLWDMTRGSAGGWAGYLSYALAFLLLGLGLGWYAARSRWRLQRMSVVLDSMLEAVTVAVPVRDASGRVVDGRVEYANAVAAQAVDLAPDDLIGRTWKELWPEGFSPALLETLVTALEASRPLDLVDYVAAPPLGEGDVGVVMDLRARPVADGFLLAWRDVSSRHRDAQAVQAANRQFAAAFEHAPVGMVLVDEERQIVRSNPAFTALTGRPPEQLAGTALEALLHPQDADAHRAEFATMTTGGSEPLQQEARLLTSNGSSRWVSMTAARIDQPGAVAVEHVEDIDDRKGYEGRLQFLADHDPLTGLFNRRRFLEELSHQLALSSRYGSSTAVVLIDLDHFKYVNDTLGHPVGDRLISAVAGGLHRRLRDSDVVCRLGGDEFAVLLPRAGAVPAVEVAESLLADIRATEVEQDGQRVRTTGSVGIAVLHAGPDGAEAGRDVHALADELLAQADLAMYAAKEAGRDGHVVFDPTGPHPERSRARFRWLEQIRVALDQDLFTLLAQPILDISSGQVTGCELLLRMRQDGRLIGPDAFLPIAERHGLSSAIDRFVIVHGIALAASQPRPPGFRWEINLAADSLGDPTIPELIESELARTGLPADALVFEITETAAIANFEAAQALAHRLTAIGCRFALDDFGAGYGSFYYLKHLPFAYLKIDGEFIRHITSSDTDQIIVQAIVGAAQQLGKQTIAEYVGDASTLAQLRVLHVDHAQGYFIGHPSVLAPA
jgi:diguanylate cyclase (GGDEF)-like protein/PAS domain S-box-containing protein